MQVQEIMTKNVEVVPESTSLTEVAQLMKRLNVGSIPVVEGGSVIGLITDRDIVIRSTAAGHDPNEVAVKDIMSKTLEFVYADQEVEDAAKIMGDKQIRRLPVLNRGKQLVGILSLGDLSVDGKKESETNEALEKISKPSKPMR